MMKKATAATMVNTRTVTPTATAVLSDVTGGSPDMYKYKIDMI